MDMPKVTDAHRMLERLAGRWSGQEKLSPSPWDPAGGMAIARINNRIALGGFAVIQDYEQERNGEVSFHGHGVFQYDANQKNYVLHWFDSMGMGANEFRGDCKDNVYTFMSKSPQGENRVTFDFRQNGKYTFKLEASMDGKQWMTFMDGTYTKSA